MTDEKAKDTYIKDSNVEILINSSEAMPTGSVPKKTDYFSIVVLAVSVLGAAVYFFLKKNGIL